MTFFTAINCMDERVQLPVIRYLQKMKVVGLWVDADWAVSEIQEGL